MSWKEAEEVYGVHHSSIAHIVQAARAHADRQQALALHNPQLPAPTKQVKGRKPVLGGDNLITILDWVEEDPALTLKVLTARIESELQKKVSQSTVEHTFQALDISYKEVVEIPAKWNANHIIRARQEYLLKWIHDVVGRPLVFIDECPFNMHVVAHKGRAV